MRGPSALIAWAECADCVGRVRWLRGLSTLAAVGSAMSRSSAAQCAAQRRLVWRASSSEHLQCGSASHRYWCRLWCSLTSTSCWTTALAPSALSQQCRCMSACTTVNLQTVVPVHVSMHYCSFTDSSAGASACQYALLLFTDALLSCPAVEVVGTVVRWWALW